MESLARSCRNKKYDISTSFRLIWMKQRSTQSSWDCEQCVTVNLTEVLSSKLVKSTFPQIQVVSTKHSNAVFVPKRSLAAQTLLTTIVAVIKTITTSYGTYGLDKNYVLGTEITTLVLIDSYLMVFYHGHAWVLRTTEQIPLTYIELPSQLLFTYM